MLGGLAYMTPLQVSNPANGRSLILYKRDVVSGPGALSTITLPLPARAHPRRATTAQAARSSAGARQTGPASDGRRLDYDTPRRREQLADRLAGAGVTPDAIEARILDDVSHAWPPEHAVDGSHDQAPEARRNRGAQARRAVNRQERSR